MDTEMNDMTDIVSMTESLDAMSIMSPTHDDAIGTPKQTLSLSVQRETFLAKASSVNLTL